MLSRHTRFVVGAILGLTMLQGCGVGYPIAGILGLTSGDSDKGVQPNTAPTVTVAAVSRQKGEVELQYTVADPEANPVSVHVEYAVGDEEFKEASAAPRSESLSALTAAPGGTPHRFVWNATSDLGSDQAVENVRFRVTPSDAAADGSAQVTGVFTVGNDPPVVSVVPVAPRQSGLVNVDLLLSDSTADPVGLSFELVGRTTDPDVSVSPGTSTVTTTRPAEGAGFARARWNSLSDLADTVGLATLRVTATDAFDSSSVDVELYVENSNAASVTIEPVDRQRTPVSVDLQLQTPEPRSDVRLRTVLTASNPNGKVMLHSDPAAGGSAPTISLLRVLATSTQDLGALTAGGPQLDTTLAGVSYRLRWDAETDLQPILAQGTTSAVVSLAITPVFTPAVGGELVGVEKVVTFSYGEQAPELRLLGTLAKPNPVMSGFSPLEFDLVDFTGVAASMAVKFTTAADPGTERTATLAVGRTSGLKTSASGVRHVVVWNTRANLGVSRTEATLRFTPSAVVSGRTATGTTTSVAVVVENDDRVAAVITSPQNGKVLDARGGGALPVEFVLVDSDQDVVDVRVEIDAGDARGFHLPTGFALTDLGTSETGTRHSLTYSPAADQLSAAQGDRREVRLWVRPEERDSGQGIGHEITFSLNLNAEPSATVHGPTHDGQSIDLVEGVVEIGVETHDAEGDSVTLITEISGDGGVTFEQPAITAVGNGRFSIDTVKAGLGADGEQQVVVRATPHDLLGGLSASEALEDPLGRGPSVITIFAVDNRTKPAPTIAPETLSGIRQGKIAIPYMLSHAFGYKCNVKVTYSVEGGEPKEATPAEDAGGEPLTALLSSRAGIQHTFFWDSSADMPTESADRVVITFEALDRPPAGVQARMSTGTTTLSVDNTIKSDLVFGQIAKSVDNRGVSEPGGVFGANGRLWICDTDNHRVLQYDGVPRFSYQGANLVLGQPDFVSTGAGGGPAGLTRPKTVFCDGARLYVAEEQGRILMWNPLPTVSGENASWELLIPGAEPSGIAAHTVAQDVHLYVADAKKGTVTRFVLGVATPDLVITGLDRPMDVKVRETPSLRLVVAEAGRSQLLVWQAPFFPNGQPRTADFVITSNDPADMEPAGIHLTENPKVYVADAKHGKVLVFEQDGDDLLAGDGSGTLTLTPEALGGSSDAVSDSSFGDGSPRSVVALGGDVLVVDGPRHRVMVFDGAAASPGSFTARAIIGQPDAHSGRANHATVDAFSLLRPAFAPCSLGIPFQI
ncbi:hypothetical protein ACFL59_07785, partial [Planctomycetota bacterium]